MYLFFLQREKACRRARALSRAGRDLLLALCFGFPPVLVQPLRVAWGCPVARHWRVWKGRRQPFWLLGRHSPTGLPSLAQVLFTHPPGSAGLALRSSHCVLGDSLAPNLPGTSGENGFQGHFQFYSSGKTFCVYLMVCSHPWLLVETAFCWQGVGWAAFRPPLPGSHEPTDQEFP